MTNDIQLIKISNMAELKFKPARPLGGLVASVALAGALDALRAAFVQLMSKRLPPQAEPFNRPLTLLRRKAFTYPPPEL